MSQTPTLELEAAFQAGIRKGQNDTWRHIGIAPKDGTRILATDGTQVGIVAWELISSHSAMRADRTFETTEIHGWFGHNAPKVPTHWQPLPAPPVDATEGK